MSPILFPAFVILLLLNNMAVANSSCGNVIARYGEHAVTDLQVNDRLSRTMKPDVLQSYHAALEAGNLEEAQSQEGLLRQQATELLVLATIAAGVDGNRMELTSQELQMLEAEEAAILSEAIRSHARDTFDPDPDALEEKLAAHMEMVHEAMAGMDHSPRAQIRLVFRRASTPEEKREETELLEKLREELVSGEVTPLEAVRQYSQAPSAARRGILGPTSTAEMPPIVSESITGMEVGEWSTPLETSQGVMLFKLMSYSAPSGPSADQERERIRENLFRLHFESMMEDAEGDDHLSKLRDLVEKKEIPLPFAPGCFSKWETERLLGERAITLNAHDWWNELEGNVIQELHAAHHEMFPREWKLERHEIRFRPTATGGVETHTRSISEIEQLWRNEFWKQAVEMDPGEYQGDPVPPGWILEIKPISLIFHVEPSTGTPQPPENPVWRQNTLFSETEATITPLGMEEYREEPYYRFEEIPPHRLREILIFNKIRELREEKFQKVLDEMVWKVDMKK
ncbi:MAG: peptidylprolyl isomerase [Candidatus Sumerlaeia bacterium]|nr:peptidylprolyl isomerase [Candidatus Sumerlaeia bacterium]